MSVAIQVIFSRGSSHFYITVYWIN